MAKDNGGTGLERLNEQVKQGAAALPGMAADMAQGATFMQAASNALKDAALDKLLGPTALFAGGLLGVLKTIRTIVRESQILERGLSRMSKLQQIEGKFETLLKSATLAKKRIEELYKFTANSPFRFEDVAEANRTLQALTLGAYSGAKAMKQVGDAAVATGTPITEMADKIGRLYNSLQAGRSIDKISFQMQYMGLATEELIAKLEALEQTGAGFSEMWAEVDKVLARTTGGMTNAKSLDDYKTRLDEATAVMERAFGEPFVDAQTRSLDILAKAARNLTPVLADVAQDMAAVKNVFVDTKTKVLDTVFASDLFAKSAIQLRQALTGLFLGMSAATIVSLGLSISKLNGTVRKFVGNVMLLNLAWLTTARSAEALDRAQRLAAVSTWAFNRGQYQLALATRVQSIWMNISTRATVLNAAAKKLATDAAGRLAVGKYALALATGTLTGALKLAWRALAALTAGMVKATVAFLGNPILAFATAATAAAYATYKWGKEVDSLVKSYEALTNSIAETNKKLMEQRRGLRTIDDLRKYRGDTIAKLNDAQAALRNFRIDFNPEGSKVKDRIGRSALQELQNDVAAKKETALQAARIDPSALGPGKDEEELIRTRVAEEENARQAQFQRTLDSTDDLTRARLMQEEAYRQAREANEGDTIRERRAAFERSPEGKQVAGLEVEMADTRGRRLTSEEVQARRDSVLADKKERSRYYREYLLPNGEIDPTRKNPNGLFTELTARIEKAEKEIADSEGAEKRLIALGEQRAAILRASSSELVRINQLILDQNDLVAKNQAKPASVTPLIRQREEALRKSGNVENARQRADDLNRGSFESLYNGTLKAYEIERERTILDLKKKGMNTARLEAAGRLAALYDQLNVAQKLYGLGSLQAKEATNAIEQERQARREFAKDREFERAVTAMTMRGDRKGARAMQDLDRLYKKQNEYESMGLTREDAAKDWRQEMMAEAVSQTPNVVADSIQSVGGGGGYSQSEPVRAAIERQLEAQRRANEYLKIIAEKVGGGGGSGKVKP
ncbi:hypothetical protein OpiT1DRAFT_05612 [Opitutaceae bacterium TAV1]|nr:hypothetical protein OpiT1DRAFT_05612 [Opitutaceae bacterium TAV1]